MIVRSISYICFLLILLWMVSSTTALAHVSADSMPDSVAEVEYSIYLEFKPNDLTVRNKLGMVFYRMKKLPEAEREFATILKKQPENYDALDGMGLVRAAQGKYDEAIQLHRKSIALNPKDMMMYYHLGSALEKKNQIKEAAEAYNTALIKFTEKYPQETENKNAAEFKKQLLAAIERTKNKQ